MNVLDSGTEAVMVMETDLLHRMNVELPVLNLKAQVSGIFTASERFFRYMKTANLLDT